MDGSAAFPQAMNQLQGRELAWIGCDFPLEITEAKIGQGSLLTAVDFAMRGRLGDILSDWHASPFEIGAHFVFRASALAGDVPQRPAFSVKRGRFGENSIRFSQ